jgi:hypothetical protein
MKAPSQLPLKIERYDVLAFDSVDHRLVARASDGHLILQPLNTGVTLEVMRKLDGSGGLPGAGRVRDAMRDFQLTFRESALLGDAHEKQRKIEIADVLRRMKPRLDARMSVVKHMNDHLVPMSHAKISAELDKLCTPAWIEKHGPRPHASAVRFWIAKCAQRKGGR